MFKHVQRTYRIFVSVGQTAFSYVPRVLEQTKYYVVAGKYLKRVLINSYHNVYVRVRE